MDPHGSTARRFPLVARPRPVCLPLPARIGRLRELAAEAERETYQGTASSVFNQAALLASDLGLPETARQWCHRHAAAYLNACPLGGMDAIRGLEPIVNLARLHIRDGRGDQGHRLLLALYEAVTKGSGAILDRITVPADLTATDADRQEVRQWLWRVIIADGTRALTSAGRWQDALTHLQQHHGVGKHMLDGRQVAVLDRATTGDHDGAQQLLTDTTPGEPWENAVTVCLSVLCRSPYPRPTEEEIGTLLDCCHQVDFRAELVVFHTRLMLSVVDAAGRSGHPGVRSHAAELVDRVLEVGDGYAARDVLVHDGCAVLMTARQRQALTEVVDACALDRQALPPELNGDLLASLDRAETVITDQSLHVDDDRIPDRPTVDRRVAAA
ncbi:hypothetical protein P3T36_004866 [Kitasatospora sp. MAP12-15]|uniref:hypothetical protein n=1 Tax=unclassified Kitasatospora TaxID=2633591 RepID=UPI0024742B8D|nr:hypothetical protein [Kitasatospora sp. MAP12-44]MDH6110202.1 hypothetical protein [Kitasatospora sp. MAP12-44]